MLQTKFQPGKRNPPTKCHSGILAKIQPASMNILIKFTSHRFYPIEPEQANTCLKWNVYRTLTRYYIAPINTLSNLFNIVNAFTNF